MATGSATRKKVFPGLGRSRAGVRPPGAGLRAPRGGRRARGARRPVVSTRRRAYTTGIPPARRPDGGSQRMRPTLWLLSALLVLQPHAGALAAQQPPSDRSPLPALTDSTPEAARAAGETAALSLSRSGWF